MIFARTETYIFNSLGDWDKIPLNLMPYRRAAGSTIESESDLWRNETGSEGGSMDSWIRGVTTLRWACIPPEHRKPGFPRGDKRERKRESANLPEHRNRKGAEPTRASDVTGQRKAGSRWFHPLMRPYRLVDFTNVVIRCLRALVKTRHSRDVIRFQAQRTEGRILKYSIKLLKLNLKILKCAQCKRYLTSTLHKYSEYYVLYIAIFFFLFTLTYIHTRIYIYIAYKWSVGRRWSVLRTNPEARELVLTHKRVSLFAESQGEPRADRSSKGYFVPSASPGWLMSPGWFKQNVGVSARGRNCPGNLPHCDLVRV